MDIDAQNLAAQIIEFVKAAPLWLACLCLFFGAFIEYVFPPFPGDTVLVAGGFFIASGALPLIPSAAALVLGSLLGCAAGWSLGSLSRNHARSKYWLDRYVGEQNLMRLEAVYARHGTWILIVNRFVPGLRGAFMVGAGVAQVPLARVLVFGLISSILWNAALIALGFLMSGSLPALITLFEDYSLIMLGLVAVVILYFIFKR